MKRLPSLQIVWCGWATAFAAEFILFSRHREGFMYGYRWTLWLGPLRICRRVKGEEGL